MHRLISLYQNFKIESLLLSIATVTLVTSGIILTYLLNAGHTVESYENSIPAEDIFIPPSSKYVYVDISGAINKPNIYEVNENTRIKHIIDMAGGLSEIAAKDFVGRNFNMSMKVSDEMKIHIPTQSEILSGTFQEKIRYLEYLTNTSESALLDNNSQSSLESNNNDSININTATAKELETLSGIGPATSEKIILNRPYSSINDLVSKDVISNNLLKKIENRITH